MGGDACVIGSWPSAGAAAPRVKPPANVAPLFRSSRRLKRFEPINLSLADEPKRKSLSRSRKYTPVSGPSRASPECPWTSLVTLLPTFFRREDGSGGAALGRLAPRVFYVNLRNDVLLPTS